MASESRSNHNNRGGTGVHLRVARLAKAQHGPVRRDQLVELKLSTRQIDYAIEVRRFRIIYPTVYAIGQSELSSLGERSPAVLAAEPDAFLADRSAGLVRGLIKRYDGPIEIVVERHHPPELKGVTARTTSTLAAFERGSYLGIPTTSM